MSEHTPGPWDATGWRVCAGIEPGQRISVICDTATNKQSRTDENEANARLIAASPEMYDALLLVRRFGSHGEIEEEDERNGMSVSFFVEAAIAKAEGREAGK